MMGASLSWIGIKGQDKAAVLAVLGLVEAPEDTEPYYVEHWMAELPSGWILVQAKDFMFPKPERMAALSAGGGQAVACSIEEHVMYSVARGYADGKAVWSIDHDGGQHGAYHLDVAGSPPPEFAVIHDRLKAQQDAEEGEAAEADYMFDIGPQLSEALCGYAFGSEKAEDVVLRPLERPRAKTGGLLGRLLGRK
jgi:hypothetical protein